MREVPDLVGEGPQAFESGRRRLQAHVDGPLHEFPQRREDRDQDQRGDNDGGLGALAGDRDEDPLDRSQQSRGQARQQPGHHDVDERPIEDRVDVVEAIPLHGDPGSNGEREDAKQVEVAEEVQIRRCDRRQQIRPDREDTGRGDPLELLPLVAVRDEQPEQQCAGAQRERDGAAHIRKFEEP